MNRDFKNNSRDEFTKPYPRLLIPRVFHITFWILVAWTVIMFIMVCFIMFVINKGLTSIWTITLSLLPVRAFSQWVMSQVPPFICRIVPSLRCSSKSFVKAYKFTMHYGQYYTSLQIVRKTYELFPFGTAITVQRSAHLFTGSLTPPWVVNHTHAVLYILNIIQLQGAIMTAEDAIQEVNYLYWCNMEFHLLEKSLCRDVSVFTKVSAKEHCWRRQTFHLHIWASST